MEDLKLRYEIEYGLAVSAYGKSDFEKSIEMANNALSNLDSTATLEAKVSPAMLYMSTVQPCYSVKLS